MYERNMEKEKIFVITIALIVGIIGTADNICNYHSNSRNGDQYVSGGKSGN